MTIREGKLKKVGEIVKIMGKEGLSDLGFDIPIGGKVTVLCAIMLNRIEEELPSVSDVARVDDIELQQVMENAARSTDNVIEQLDGDLLRKFLPRHKLQSLEKQLRSIRVTQSGGGEKCSVTAVH